MAPTFTVDQVLGLAPDAASASAGKGLATTRKWVSLCKNAEALWGECQGSGSTPYQVRIDLSEPAFKCSCPSRKFPCKHGIGLLLLWSGSADAFQESAAPAWVTEWLDTRKARAEKKAEQQESGTQKQADPVAQAKRAEKRESRVEAGIEELETWLKDLVRRGFAAAKAEPASFWTRMEARMVDAQAPGLSRYVRSLFSACSSGEGWEERTLREAGRLYLLIQSWKNQSALAEDFREEIRTLVGFAPSKEVVLAGDPVQDLWYVWGQRVEELEDGLRLQRTWLQGTKTKRWAITLSYARKGMPFEFSFVPGSAYESELVFYPSSVPRRALEKKRGQMSLLSELPTVQFFDEALAEYASALAANPFVEVQPIAIRAARLVPQGNGFVVADSTNCVIPLRGDSEEYWKAYAGTGGQPVVLFGEWNESMFTLLSYNLNGVHRTVKGGVA